MEKHEHARKGCDSYFKGEIFELIGVLCGIVAGIALVFGLAGLKVGSNSVTGVGGIVMIVFGVALAVFMVLGAIFQIRGLIIGSKEVGSFKAAIAFVIIAVVLNILSYFMGENSMVSTISDIIAKISDIIMIVLICDGIKNLVPGTDLAKSANTTSVVATSCIVITAICNIVGNSTLSQVMTIIAGVMAIVYYIMFLVFLNKARKTL